MNFLSVVVPIFGLIFAGWLLKAIGLFPAVAGEDRERLRLLHRRNRHHLPKPPRHQPDLLLDPWIYLITIVPIAAIIVIAFVVARLMKLEDIAIPVFVICAFFGNTGYVGFPLNIAVQGQESLALTAFVSTIYTVIVFTFGVYLCQRYSATKKNGLQLHKIPIFWAAAAGLILSVGGDPGHRPDAARFHRRRRLRRWRCWPPVP